MGFALRYGNGYRDEVRGYLRRVKEEGCCLCGYKKCFDALEFHHVNDNKKKELSKIKHLPAAIREVEKCILVCANCHREIHTGSIEGMGDVQTIRHKMYDKQVSLEFVE